MTGAVSRSLGSASVQFYLSGSGSVCATTALIMTASPDIHISGLVYRLARIVALRKPEKASSGNQVVLFGALSLVLNERL